MFNKFVDVLKEVFWLKKSTAKKQPHRGPAKTRKPALKLAKPAKVPKTKAPAVDPNLVQAGKITHYFERIKVCVVKITQGSILIGDRLTIKGPVKGRGPNGVKPRCGNAALRGALRPKTSFVQKVWSMQIENKDVKVARKGQLIGLKVDKPVAVGDLVYK